MNYIVEYENALDSILCDQLIDFFNKSNKTSPGKTMSGVRLHIKNTIDLHLSKEMDNEFIRNADSIIFQTTNKYTEKYLFDNIHFINSSSYGDTGYQIQCYKKGEGFYEYHNDVHIDIDKFQYRILTYLYYLNDVEEGGETVFNGDKIKIKPKKGKMIIFPSCSLFPHKGLIPISNDKYILTGWLYGAIPSS
jgi:Rps23 Pro-64 3,4-dihydroxylase Tpa1-like proline 4-hydroxylase